MGKEVDQNIYVMCPKCADYQEFKFIGQQDYQGFGTLAYYNCLKCNDTKTFKVSDLEKKV